MRKTKEVLRLRYELGLGQRAIARACSISQGAVHNYLKKAAAAGISWPPANRSSRAFANNTAGLVQKA
jgi:predicted transcriptional regulator